MRQSRLMSLAEALANVAVGYGVAVLTQMIAFPLFGLQATLAQKPRDRRGLHHCLDRAELGAALDVRSVQDNVGGRAGPSLTDRHA